jgi:beta-mannanase
MFFCQKAQRIAITINNLLARRAQTQAKNKNRVALPVVINQLSQVFTMNILNVISSYLQRARLFRKGAVLVAAMFCLGIAGANAQTNFKTLNYLYSIKGNTTLGGMHNRQPNSDPGRYSRQLNGVIGQWPALYSADFQFEPAEIAARQTMINQVITEWNNGAVVQLMWHACNPAKSRPCYWDSNGVLSSMTNTEWNQLLTNGTAINNNWKAMMDEIAVYLQQLKNAGVEVLFRPLHEMNQGMFWWGGRPGSNGTAALYRLTRDYLQNTKGLNNLIWVWNLQDFSSLSSDLNNYDPGSAYWDILSLDMYWSDGQGYTTAKYNALLNKAGGKPIAIGECEDLPSPNLLAQQPQWTFFMGWSELVFSGNTNAKIQDTYLSSRVRTLNEMPGWNNVSQPSSSSSSSSSAPATIYIQAESYSNMSGVVTGAANDGGSGTAVGSIDTNDWMTYNNINIPTSGSYTIAYRVASPSGGAVRFEEAGGGALYGTHSIPATGGWNTWTTVYHSVTLSAGNHNFGLKANPGGWNLNWFSITKN